MNNIFGYYMVKSYLAEQAKPWLQAWPEAVAED
jgi:hypothetical protein